MIAFTTTMNEQHYNFYKTYGAMENSELYIIEEKGDH